MAKRLPEYEHYSTNPLVDINLLKSKFQLVDRPEAIKQGDMIADKNGVVYNDRILTITKKYIYDPVKFTKVFFDTNVNWFDLTRTTGKLLGYIMGKCITPDSDVFVIDYNLARVELGQKTPHAVFKSLKELLEKRIIARAGTSVTYFINPHLLFNGNRVKYIKLLEKRDGHVNTLDNKFILPEMGYEE